MREFVELLVLADHACSNPHVERLEVYEPIRMQASWVNIFRCCSQVFSEPYAHVETAPVWRPLSARVEAA